MKKSAVRKIWLALATASLLCSGHLALYTSVKSRYVFSWQTIDLLPMFLAIVIAAVIFLIAHLIVITAKRRHWRLLHDCFFVLVCAVSLAVLTRRIGTELGIASQARWATLLVVATVVIGGIVRLQKTVEVLVSLTLILSPLLPIFFLSALSYDSYPTPGWIAPAEYERRWQQKAPLEESSTGNNCRNVYLLLFDEWSYQRTMATDSPPMPRLSEWMEAAIVFHDAHSPGPETFHSVPGTLFQTEQKVTLRETTLGFSNGEFRPAHEFNNLFRVAREAGCHTYCIGTYHNYPTLVGEDVDECLVGHYYKYQGPGWLWKMTLTHLLQSLNPGIHPSIIPAQSPRIVRWFWDGWRQHHHHESIMLVQRWTQTLLKHSPSNSFVYSHIMLPHDPLIYDSNGLKRRFMVNEVSSPDAYRDNLGFLDTILDGYLKTLQKTGRLKNSMVVAISDHTWRFDPELPRQPDRETLTHVPMFIWMPGVEQRIDVHDRFNTVHLGKLIDGFLKRDLTSTQLQSLVENLQTEPRETQ